MNYLTRLFSVVALLAVLPAVGGADLAPAAGTRPATRLAPPDWPRVLADLASDSYLQREAAQAVLERLPPEALPELEERARTSADPEVQARLLHRANEIRSYVAVHPTPFTFSLKDATVLDVVAAMNGNATTPFIAGKELGNDHPRFTIVADHLSFPELYLKVSEQHPLYFDTTNTLPVLQISARRMVTPISSAGFLVSASINQGRELKNNQFVVAPWYELRVTVYSDPRVRVVRNASTPTLAEARDNNGADMTGGVAINPPYVGLDEMRSTLPSLPTSATSRLKPVAGGTSMTRVKGSLKVMVAVEMKHMAVEDIETKVNQPIALPKGTLTLKSINRQPGFSITPQWSVKQFAPPPAAAASADEGEMNLLMCSISDSAGKNLGSFCEEPHSGQGAYGGNAAPGPLHMDIYFPIRVQEVVIPFELKDIPLPPLLP